LLSGLFDEDSLLCMEVLRWKSLWAPAPLGAHSGEATCPYGHRQARPWSSFRPPSATFAIFAPLRMSENPGC